MRRTSRPGPCSPATGSTASPAAVAWEWSTGRTQLELGRPVALKLIAPRARRRRRVPRAVPARVAVTGGIDHPNVVPVYEAGEADGRLFIAMRCVDGLDLGALVDRDGPSTRSAPCTWSRRGSALDAAHRRDARPSRRQARQHPRRATPTAGTCTSPTSASRSALGSDGMTRTGQFVGSLDYVAPEQVRGDAVDPGERRLRPRLRPLLRPHGPPPVPARERLRADDRAPRGAAARAERAAARAADGAGRRRRPALAKAPEDRFATAGELGEAARAALGGAMPAAASAPPRRAAPKRAGARGGRRWLVVAGVVGALAAGGGAVASGVVGGGDEAPAQVAGDADPRGAGASGAAADDGAGGPAADDAAATGPAGMIARRRRPRPGRPPRAATAVASIPVGKGPEGVAVDGTRVWVVNAPTTPSSRSTPRRHASSRARHDGRQPRRRRGRQGDRLDHRLPRPTAERIRRQRQRPSPPEDHGRPQPEGITLGKQLVWAANSRTTPSAASTARAADASVRRSASATARSACSSARHASGSPTTSTGRRRQIDVATAEVVGRPIPSGKAPRGVVEAQGRERLDRELRRQHRHADRREVGPPIGDAIRVGATRRDRRGRRLRSG